MIWYYIYKRRPLVEILRIYVSIYNFEHFCQYTYFLLIDDNDDDDDDDDDGDDDDDDIEQ